MAEFDFNALLENPTFQFGMGLFGGANPRNAPVLQAMHAVQAMKKNKLAEEKLKQDAALQEKHGRLYEAQIEDMIRKGKAEQEAAVRQGEWAKEMSDLLKGGGQVPTPQQQQPVAPQAPAIQQPAQVAPPPQSPTPFKTSSWLKPEWRTRWIGQESEGHQMDPKTGLPLTSDKGAVGRTQVLLSTGPEAAALAGEPWDARRLAYDAAYNERLGDAYLNKQFEDFQGNPAHAFAAYNAGPGATRKALDTAEKAKRPDIWLSLLPKETRDYVSTILGPQPPTVSAEQQAKTLPPTSPLGLRNPALPIAIKAAQGAAMGIKGAREFIDVAKMSELKNVPAGSYQQDAQGNLAYVPNPAEQERLAHDRERLANEKERLANEQRRMENEEKRLNKPPPSNLTEAEGKATAYYSQMLEARKTLTELQGKGFDMTSTKNQAGVALAGGSTNPLASAKQQQAKQAQEQWAEAYLRFKTGAATNADEIARNVRTFFPQIGDAPAVVKQKEEARKKAEEAITVTAGRGVGKLTSGNLPAGWKVEKVQ